MAGGSMASTKCCAALVVKEMREIRPGISEVEYELCEALGADLAPESRWPICKAHKMIGEVSGRMFMIDPVTRSQIGAN